MKKMIVNVWFSPEDFENFKRVQLYYGIKATRRDFKSWASGVVTNCFMDLAHEAEKVQERLEEKLHEKN